MCAVWIGNNEGAISLGEGRAGGVVAAPVWADYVKGVYSEFKPEDCEMCKNGDKPVKPGSRNINQ